MIKLSRNRLALGFLGLTALVIVLSSYFRWTLGLMNFQPRCNPNVQANVGSHLSDSVNELVVDESERSSYIPILIVCGGGSASTDEARVLLNSLLLLSSANLHFNFLTDEGGAKLLKTMFKRLRSPRVNILVDIHILNETWVLTKMDALGFNQEHHHSHVWGASKMLIQWYFDKLDRLLVLDTDMVFVQDPNRLYQEYDDQQHPGWIYRMVRVNPNVVCSCVILVNMNLAREQVKFPDTLKYLQHKSSCRFNGKTYRCPQGDQNIYNSLVRHFPDKHWELPTRWNVDKCDRYKGLKNNTGSVGVLHRNCYEDGTKDLASAQFDFYTQYKWDWHSDIGTGKVSVRILPPRNPPIDTAKGEWISYGQELNIKAKK